MGNTIYDGRLSIGKAGTAQPLSDGINEDYANHPLQAEELLVTASGVNGGTIAIGNRYVVASQAGRTGERLEKNEQITLIGVKLDEVWIDGTTSGDSVHFLMTATNANQDG
jgi:hypothetical protein